MERLTTMEPSIEAFRSLGSGRILLQFGHGPWVEIDLADVIAIGNMCSKLADDEYLAQGKIGDYGHWLEWPGELDIGADQLWERGILAEPVPAGTPQERKH